MFWQRLSSALLFAAVAAFLWRFPVAHGWLAAGFAVYAGVLTKAPRAWLVVVPAAMPVLDLATVSGWFFFDAFDALVLLTLAMLLWRQPLRRDDLRVGWPLGIGLAVLVVSYVFSAALVLVPWPAIDGNSFASYYSPFNGLRVAKGFVWPLLLLPWLRRSIEHTSQTGRYLVAGLLLGLCGVALVGIYEHWLFVGLFNFDRNYRIVGPFSSMHTGDGHIDLWLAVTIPLIAAPFVRRGNMVWQVAALVLCGPVLYVLLATGSRGPFLATGAALAAMFGLLLFVWARRGRRARALVAYPMIAGLLAGAALPFVVPTELGTRFKRTGRDFETRMAHFRHALSIRDKGVVTRLFGVGLGAYPRYYARHHLGAHPPARYSFDGPAGRRYLTLTSGDNLYFGQKVAARPETPYRLAFTYRTKDPRARLTVSLCEKWLLQSQRCSWHSYSLLPTGGKWVRYEVSLRTNEIGRPRGRIGSLSRQPVWLSLHTARVRDGLSLDDIRLVTNGGRNLVRNGSFDRGNDYWFWTVDNHLPWHTKNMAVNVLFDQGWVGLAGVVLLFGSAVVSLFRALWAGYAVAIPWTGAMTGYLVMAVVVSPFDQPRLAMLFYLLCMFSILQFFRGWAPLDRAPQTSPS